MNKPINPEIANILKIKRFDKPTYNLYINGELEFANGRCCNWNREPDYEEVENPISAPSIAETVMWIKDNHGIWISVDCDCYGVLWFSKLSVASEKNWDDLDLRHEIISAINKFPNEFNSPEETYEAAIKYVLTNLIK